MFPDVNDFVGGMARLLKPQGTITLEFPHVQQLLDENQFDTIYHEHFSYYSLLTIEIMATRHGLVLFDVEEIPTHGGSLRVYLAHAGVGPAAVGCGPRPDRAGSEAAGLDDARELRARSRNARGAPSASCCVS